MYFKLSTFSLLLMALMAAEASAQSVAPVVRLPNMPNFSTTNTRMLNRGYAASPWTPRTTAIPARTYNFQYPTYNSYFQQHAINTTRGLTPSWALPSAAGPVIYGGRYATQAQQAWQAMQATQARQYQQPAFRRWPY